MTEKKIKSKNIFMFGAILNAILIIIVIFQLGIVNANLDVLNDNLIQGNVIIEEGDEPTDMEGQDPDNDMGNQEPTVDMAEIIDDDSIKGDANAPVTIVEFSDFECPFCARFYEQTLPQIEEEYIETGQVKLVFRDFPLTSIHPNAQKAAEAAECAGEQEMYWEMHDVLFEEGVSGGVSTFKQYAEDLGLDTEEFNSCLDSGEMADEVSMDMTDGTALGIRGTPGFIINGQLVSGAQPFSVFQQIIESELEG